MVGKYLRGSARLYMWTIAIKDILCNLFRFFPDLDITNYTDGNTPQPTKKNANKVLHDLEKMQNSLFGSPIFFWRQTQKSHIFLRTKHKKFKLT